jgi:phosphate transport system permease protein
MFSGVTSDEVFVEAAEGTVTLHVGGEFPLEFIDCTNDVVWDSLGLVEWDIIDSGTSRVYEVDETLIMSGTLRSYGRSFLVAGITMAVMVLPFVIKSMEEAMKAVPPSYIDASLALGATKWRTISKVVLKAARDGLVTGVILGMGRIIGDTAIVWLALGGSVRMTGNQPWYSPENWLSTLRSGGGTLTTYIYYTSPAGEGNQFDVAFGASLVLIAVIVLLNIIAAVIGKAGGQRRVEN